MASVNFEKIKSPQEVKAMLRHCDKDERMKHNHSNEQINKDLTHNNFQTKVTYAEAYDRFDKRMAYLDSLEGANVRKDRVVCFGLSIPCPVGIPPEREEEFFKKVVMCIAEQYGGENIVSAYFHRDEKHTYSDTETKKQRESLNHAHIYVIPEIAGKLNGKEFSSKKNMLKLNKTIHKMCQDTFGIDFMDGSKTKSTKSVETLKRQSKEIELQQSIEDYKKRAMELNEREEALNIAEKHFKEKNVKLHEEQQKALEMQKKASDKASEYNEMIQQLYKDTQYITDSYDDIKMRYRELEKDEKVKEIQEMQRNVTENTNEIAERERKRMFDNMLRQKEKEDKNEKEIMPIDDVISLMNK